MSKKNDYLERIIVIIPNLTLFIILLKMFRSDLLKKLLFGKDLFGKDLRHLKKGRKTDGKEIRLKVKQHLF